MADERRGDEGQTAQPQSDTHHAGPPLVCTLRLSSEHDTVPVTVDAYTYEQLRGSCEYIRGLMDFGVSAGAFPQELGCGGPDPGSGEEPEADGRVFSVHTGTCRAALAAAVVHWLVKGVVHAGAEAAPLDVDGSNAAELLALADVWCVPALKAHVLAALCRGPCAGFRRPAANSAAVEGVPQVAALAAQALAYGIGDPDGGLGRLYAQCTAWMAAWPARAWPTRTFAAMSMPIQEDVLAAAKARAADPDAAPAALAACRALAAALPPVAWAARPREMCEQLVAHTLAALWGKFPEVCASAGARQDRTECWGQLLEELRAHVAEYPEPGPAVWALAGGRSGGGWDAGCHRALLYGPPPPPSIAAQRAALQLRARLQQQGRVPAAAWDAEPAQEEEEQSWLGEEEAQHMAALHGHVHSWVVRHMPLVARCATFQHLPQQQQRRIRALAAAGLTGGPADAGGMADAEAVGSVRPSPGPGARAGGRAAAAAAAAGSATPGSAARGLRPAVWASAEEEAAAGAGAAGGAGGRAGGAAAGGGAAMWTIALEPEPLATPGSKGSSARKPLRPHTAGERASPPVGIAAGRGPAAAAVRGRAGAAAGAAAIAGADVAAGPGPGSAAAAQAAGQAVQRRPAPRRQPLSSGAAASPAAAGAAAEGGAPAAAPSAARPAARSTAAAGKGAARGVRPGTAGTAAVQVGVRAAARAPAAAATAASHNRAAAVSATGAAGSSRPVSARSPAAANAAAAAAKPREGTAAAAAAAARRPTSAASASSAAGKQGAGTHSRPWGAAAARSSSSAGTGAVAPAGTATRHTAAERRQATALGAGSAKAGKEPAAPPSPGPSVTSQLHGPAVEASPEASLVESQAAVPAVAQGAAAQPGPGVHAAVEGAGVQLPCAAHAAAPEREEPSEGQAGNAQAEQQEQRLPAPGAAAAAQQAISHDSNVPASAGSRTSREDAGCSCSAPAEAVAEAETQAAAAALSSVAVGRHTSSPVLPRDCETASVGELGLDHTPDAAASAVAMPPPPPELTHEAAEVQASPPTAPAAEGPCAGAEGGPGSEAPRREPGPSPPAAEVHWEPAATESASHFGVPAPAPAPGWPSQQPGTAATTTATTPAVSKPAAAATRAGPPAPGRHRAQSAVASAAGVSTRPVSATAKGAGPSGGQPASARPHASSSSASASAAAGVVGRGNTAAAAQRPAVAVASAAPPSLPARAGSSRTRSGGSSDPAQRRPGSGAVRASVVAGPAAVSRAPPPPPTPAASFFRPVRPQRPGPAGPPATGAGSGRVATGGSRPPSGSADADVAVPATAAPSAASAATGHAATEAGTAPIMVEACERPADACTQDASAPVSA
ncbi:hypothetical protein HYH02_007296 [Chlamydomonas schloesseri]|uniref:BTBD8 BACK domain-containing protein n=1 Tax=Chlamydomonas schloesseri TaxID=2026947 RepID=A0A835WJ28_9CHLO|nr:hypothetical protein HYH02_007296 [Chlamydomonas schloesseri]|eukprot:KAG2447840.1 hypothetical protein HYH02_007296 [Chlamydomonas schloesseri]